jgi:NAD(P)H-hydrate epimerase
MLRDREVPTILTPHDGEYALLTGHRPGDDRISAARQLAADTNATVLLKGPTTVVAAPDGRVRLVVNGDQRLATAGTGDVLAGIIGAVAAGGVDILTAGAAGAWLHACAASFGPPRGFVAGDLLTHLPEALASLAAR